MAALELEDVDAEKVLGSGPRQPTLPVLRTGLLVAAGGGVGAGLRFLLAVIAPTVTTPTLVEVPWASLWANVIGCLALGALTGVLEVRRAPAWTMPLLGTGLCGGFTTMSLVVLEGSAMLGADFPIIAVGYGLATAVLCLGAMALGLLVARRVARHHPDEALHDGARTPPARPGRPGARVITAPSPPSPCPDSSDDAPTPDEPPTSEDPPTPDPSSERSPR